MAKKRKPSKSNYDSSFRQYRNDDAIERKLNSLTKAVLAMMEQRGQGAAQTFRDFNYEDAFNFPSAEMFAENLQADTVMGGPITDYADEVTGSRRGMSTEVSQRAGDQYMQDVYRMIMKNLAGNPKRNVR